MRLALNLDRIQLHPVVYRVYDFLARWVPPVLRWTSLVFLCLFVGYSVALVGKMAAIFWAGVACLVLAPLILSQEYQRVRIGIVYLCLGYVVVLPPFVKATTESLYGPPQILLCALGVMGLPAFLRYCWSSRLMTWSFVCLLLFAAMAAISTLMGRSHPIAAVNQAFNDVKVLLMITCGFAAAWTARSERIMDGLARYFWIYASAWVAFEWGATSIYYKIFSHFLPTADQTHLFPFRASGPFEFPPYLAAAASFFLIYSFSRVVTTKDWRSWILASGGNALLLLFAVQRQALAGAILACFMVLLLSRPQALLRRGAAAILGLLFVAALLFSTYADYIIRDIESWGTTRSGEVTAPRAQIYQTSVDIAHQYFPLGAGLGTYGGAGASKYDDSLYYENGFNQLWWFRKQGFLMDTYWPNPLAETGVFGAAALLGFYGLMQLFLVVKAFTARPDTRVYWLMSAGGYLSVLQLTITHPAFTDPRLFLLTAVTFGLAVAREREARAADKAVAQTTAPTAIQPARRFPLGVVR